MSTCGLPSRISGIGIPLLLHGRTSLSFTFRCPSHPHFLFQTPTSCFAVHSRPSRLPLQSVVNVVHCFCASFNVAFDNMRFFSVCSQIVHNAQFHIQC